MGKLSEKVLKNKEVCQTLNVSDYGRRQMISAGILEEPISIGGRYPRHTLSQIIRAQNRITELAENTNHRSSSAGRRKTRPLSEKMIRSIRETIRIKNGEKL